MNRTCSVHHGPPKSSSNNAQIVAMARTAGATGNLSDNAISEETAAAKI